MTDQPMAARACEHYWAYHVHSNLSVRLCQLCHEPDWDDLRRMLDEAQRNGRAFERGDIVALAVERNAKYDQTKPCSCGRKRPDGSECVTLIRSGVPFADLLADLPPGWPGGA